VARFRILALLTLALGLTAAAPAQARTLLGDLPEGIRADPLALSVTPRDMVYAFDGYERSFGVYLKRGAGTARRLRQFDSLGRLEAPGGDRGDIDVSVSASDELVAVSVASRGLTDNDEGFPPTESAGPSAVEVATRDGRARRLASCRKGRLDFVAVDGRTVAYVGAGCVNVRAGIAVHDLARGTKRTISPPRGNGFGNVRLAGRYLVGEVVNGPRSGTLIVYDWHRGRALYSAPKNGSENEFDIDRSGRLVTLGAGAPEGCDNGEVRWRSPAEPSAKIINGVGCSNDLRIAGGRVIASRLGAAEQPEGVLRTEYVVSDLRGNATPLFNGLRYGYGRYPVLWDGRNVGYSTPACDASERIVVDTLAELQANGPLAPESCTVATDELPTTVRVKPNRSVVIRGRCPLGCQAVLRAFDPSVGRLLPFGSFEGMPLDAARGATEAAEGQLSEEDFKRLVEAGRLDVELRVEVHQVAGPRTTTTRPLTLLPPA
jgi:hypothetical protein